MSDPMTVTVPFLDRPLHLQLPGGWNLVGEFSPAPRPALPDVAGALCDALERPLGAELPWTLSGLKIVLAVDDVSRPTPVRTFFPALLDWLRRRGASLSNLEVVFALGVHRKMSASDAAGRLGLENLSTVAWHNHDCRDDALHVDLGATFRGTPVRLNKRLAAADLIVCVGSIEPHPLLGFGGGLKMIVPGLAHEQTIAANHMQGVTPRRCNFVGDVESAMRLDLEEGALKLGRPIFIVNALLNERQQVHGFVCGDPVGAHREGVRRVQETARHRLQQPVDVAIVTSSPLNADLRQGMKGIAHAEPAVRDGGLILAFLECRSGIGDVAIAKKSLPNGLLRAILRVLGRGRVLWFVDKVKRGAGTEERFLSHFSLQVVRKTRILVHSPNLPPDTGKRMGIFRQFDTPGELMSEAVRLAPAHASVAVFPMSAATYAQLLEG